MMRVKLRVDKTNSVVTTVGKQQCRRRGPNRSDRNRSDRKDTV